MRTEGQKENSTIGNYMIVRAENLAQVVQEVNTVMQGNPGVGWQPFGPLTSVPDDSRPGESWRFVYCQVMVTYNNSSGA